MSRELNTTLRMKSGWVMKRNHDRAMEEWGSWASAIVPWGGQVRSIG